MTPYIFQGTVLPERAQLTLQVAISFEHVTAGATGTAKVSILLNQVIVWVESNHAWDGYTLRNVVKTMVQNQLDVVGYLKGHSYYFEVTRALNQDRGIDLVFGIDTPCRTKRAESTDLQAELARLREKTVGPNGVFLHRRFSDLVSSMKHADDTGFYCYRAIESLRLQCAAVHGLSSADKSKQWEKFRTVSGCDEQTIRTIKVAADPLRHGQPGDIDSEGREKLLTSTFDVVDAYLKDN